MSVTYVYNGAQNWNYLGRFYGVDPGVLAAYNGQAQKDLAAPVNKGFKLKVPSAADLVSFYPRFKEMFPTTSESFGLALRPPTVVRLGRVYDGPDGDFSAYREPMRDFATVPWVPKDGNALIVTAARMRRNSHAGDNYEMPAAMRSPNPAFQPTNIPDVTSHNGLKNVWKCNMFVGDSLYAAGYNWPMSEFHRYLGPDGLMTALGRPNPYTRPVWISPAYADGKLHPGVENPPPTPEQLKDVLPGDVMLLHAHYTTELPHHSAIITSKPMLNPRDGRYYLRTIDIYGERWYSIDDEGIAAILRPRLRLAAPPAASVAGDPNRAEHILDHVEDERVNSDPVEMPVFSTVEE